MHATASDHEVLSLPKSTVEGLIQLQSAKIAQLQNDLEHLKAEAASRNASTSEKLEMVARDNSSLLAELVRVQELALSSCAQTEDLRAQLLSKNETEVTLRRQVDQTTVSNRDLAACLSTARDDADAFRKEFRSLMLRNERLMHGSSSVRASQAYLREEFDQLQTRHDEVRAHRDLLLCDLQGVNDEAQGVKDEFKAVKDEMQARLLVKDEEIQREKGLSSIAERKFEYMLKSKGVFERRADKLSQELSEKETHAADLSTELTEVLKERDKLRDEARSLSEARRSMQGYLEEAELAKSSLVTELVQIRAAKSRSDSELQASKAHMRELEEAPACHVRHFEIKCRLHEASDQYFDDAMIASIARDLLDIDPNDAVQILSDEITYGDTADKAKSFARLCEEMNVARQNSARLSKRINIAPNTAETHGQVVCRRLLKVILDRLHSPIVRCRSGPMKFMGELFVAGMITDEICYKCIDMLTQNLDGQETSGSVHALYVLLAVVGQVIDTPASRWRMNEHLARLCEANIPRRARKSLQKILNLRNNGWMIAPF